MGLTKILNLEGFNLRERLNVYAGATLGALVPIALMRYALSNSGVQPESALGEALAWGVSTLFSTPFTIFPCSSILGGFCVGYMEARRLRNKRYGNEE